MNSTTLKIVRQRLAAGDALTLEAMEQLRTEADAALAMTPVSVMDKTRTPPSGDKHDFMSVAPYWWPNPQTPDGLPHVRRDGEIHPDRYTNATDLSALDAMATSVCTLIWTEALTGREDYGRHATTLLRRWFIEPATRMNPHLRFGQAIPGICEGRGIGIIDTKAFVPLVRMLRLSPPQAWTREDQRHLAAWFSEYLDWLLSSDLGLTERLEKNNHGTWFDAQAAWFALFCDRPVVTRQVVEQVLQRRIAMQIEPDGCQPLEQKRTRPMMYTCFNLMGLMHLADAAEQVGVDLWHASTPDGRSIAAVAKWIAPYAWQEWDRRLDLPDVRETILLPALAWAAWGLNDAALKAAVTGSLSSQRRRLRMNLSHPI